MKVLALLFAVFMIVGSATQAYACGAGGHKGGDEVVEAVE